MATFYYNRLSNENIYSQWTKHLQTDAYIRDIDGILKKNRQELENAFQSSSTEQIKAIHQVCGDLDYGFAELCSHLQSINSNISELRGEINEMAAMLDWKLSMLIEELRLTNQLLGHIAKLLRIPDSQKQRVYYIERGLKYLKNAILEGISSSFYSDALESFKEAEKIERKDYITLNRIGQIFLYSKEYLNVPLAEEYFLKSAREAFAEANVGGTTTSNNFTPIDYKTSIYSQNHFLAATAEAYLYAGRTCYLQQKLLEATSHAEKAYKLIPDFVEAGFEQAKYLAANNQENEAVRVLETVIEKDRFYSIKTMNDQDLSTKLPILKMLERFQQKTLEKAKSELNVCKNMMKSGSKARRPILEIEKQINMNSFLSGMKALDLLGARYRMPYYIYEQRSEEVRRKSIDPNLKISEFLEKENQSREAYEDAIQEAKGEIIETNVAIFGWGAAALGFVIGFFRGCSVQHFSMEWGNWFLTILICAAIGALIGFLVGHSKDPNVIDDPYLQQ
jgi:hypothetical protein